MTRASCDPALAGLSHWQTQLSKGNGTVNVYINWTWDGVSTPATGCAGPIVNDAGTGWALRVQNSGADTWTCQVPKAKGVGNQTITIAPGDDRTFTKTVLSSRGLDTVSDIDDLDLTLG